MNPILLDTNAYAAFKRGDTEALAIVQRAPLIGISTVVLGELFGGFAAGTRERQNRADLSEFLASPRVAVLPVDQETAERYATTYLALRTAATPIPTNDMWIAATAARHGMRVFTFDAHFRFVSAVKSGRTVAELEAP